MHILFLLASLSPMSATGAAAAEPPVRLVSEESAGGVRLSVVGESPVAVRGRYSLDVQSDPASGGNRTAQRGTVDLAPGRAATLMSLTLGNAEGWTARLRFEPAGGEPYEIVARASDQP
ncbi:curli-like amyloid fiber formation chaperone CsgH [Sphingosinicella terrae]|jgi:hypothetical protein|uniref:curli-like amyloid fiber formation chaperone CsgH n=1 Tax=Sphingosinicella terrae TaxID=2172047 RepID=UPI000E0D4F03|nr:curli-like amyloid fiber formation chaperone CsgH [Sphingosinicella terrae]